MHLALTRRAWPTARQFIAATTKAPSHPDDLSAARLDLSACRSAQTLPTWFSEGDRHSRESWISMATPRLYIVCIEVSLLIEDFQVSRRFRYIQVSVRIGPPNGRRGPVCMCGMAELVQWVNRCCLSPTRVTVMGPKCGTAETGVSNCEISETVVRLY
jgi:hypothetical protein